MKLLILAFWLLQAAPIPAITSDPKEPAYWGLKKGEYIPTSENCMGGTFESPNHNKHKKFDFETCATITYLTEDNQ